MNSGEFSKSWSESTIVPVYKSGSMNNPSNFRVISMLNTMYKIFSNIIFDRITRWVEEFNILDESQNGFRRERAPVDNMFILQAMAQKYISKPGGRFYVLYVDFEKVFDSIPHHKLFTCLHNVGFKGKLYKVLVSMYSNMSSRIRIDNKLTKAVTCNVGSKQGDVTSTIIFNLYINELSRLLRERNHRGIFITDEVPDILCVLFADDVANCSDTVIELQRQLNSIHDFCLEYGMKVNERKTEIIVFRNGGPLRANKHWLFHGNAVNVTSVYKYMGISFTPKLSWTKAKENLALQAQKSINAFKSFRIKFGRFPAQEYFRIFDSMLKPILVYGSEIWGTEKSETIERVQIKFCKDYLRLGNTVNDCMALGECGRLPLCCDYFLTSIKY